MSAVANSLPEPQTFVQMQMTGDKLAGWLWQGFISFGCVSLLTSRWKMGKTTLLSVLLNRLSDGGMLAGLKVVPAPALIVSEESAALWLGRGDRTPFGNNVRWLCRPFVGKPSREQWQALLNHLLRLTAGESSLIVIDPLPMVLPGSDENNAGSIIDALSPVQQLASAGHAVLLLHHPRKGRSLEPRGSGAITSIADIIIQMDTPNEAEHPNRRWLRARGRPDGVIAERLIELNSDHTDYLVVDTSANDLTDGISIIEWVLKDAATKYSRDEILKNWPEMREKPHKASLWKWLEEAVSEGRIQRDGEGRPYKPFRYWLREREVYFLPDLPPLDPVAFAMRENRDQKKQQLQKDFQITQADLDYAREVVDQALEKERRKKLLRKQQRRAKSEGMG